MKSRLSSQLALAAIAAGLAFPACAQKTFHLTIGASHPTTLPFIKMMRDFVEPEINRRLAAQGNHYKIEWREAYGGVLYKANATLTSVQDGIADMGWVFTSLEAARMPLQQVSNYTPGVSNDPKLVADVFNEMLDTMPALQAEWNKYNVMPLGAMTGDPLELFTKTPIRTLEDLQGKKLSAAGTIGAWLHGTGAIPVDGALPTYYNDAKTGVTDGALTITTGVLGIKLYEVASYMTRTNLGVFYAGALAINKDSYKKLPPEVQKVIREVGREYSDKVSESFSKTVEVALKVFATVGQKQDVPVQVSDLPQAERVKWFKGMPNIAENWVKANEARGLPARKVLKAYMAAVRKHGARPVRDWDKL